MSRWNERGPNGRFISAIQAMKQDRSRRVRQARSLKKPVSAPAVTFRPRCRAAQIYSQGFELAMVSPQSDGYHQATTWAYCKDFFHDSVWAMVLKKPYSIYGFSYNPNKDKPLDMENCSFLFRNTEFKSKEPEFHSHREACQQFLNGFEEQLGFSPSQIFEIPHEEAPCWLVVGDKGWQHAPPMVGLFTLLIRLGYMHTLGETYQQTLEKARAKQIKIGSGGNYAGNRDSSYISEAWAGISKILERGLEIFHPKMEDNYPASVVGFNRHDNFGPVAFTRGIENHYSSTRKAAPFWYRPEIWSK